MTTIAILPARGGSVGVTRKNARLLDGKPVLAYAVESSKNAKRVDEVWVTTEDAELKQIALDCGAHVLDRPACLSRDDVQLDEVWLYSLRQLQDAGKIDPLFCTLALLQPNNIFRTGKHIDEAIELYKRMGDDGTVFSAYCDDKFHWSQEVARDDEVCLDTDMIARPVHFDPHYRFGRQWKPKEELVYAESGAIYVVDAKKFGLYKNRMIDPMHIYEMSPEDSVDIDTEFDLMVVQQMIEWRKNHAVGN